LSYLQARLYIIQWINLSWANVSVCSPPSNGNGFGVLLFPSDSGDIGTIYGGKAEDAPGSDKEELWICLQTKPVGV